MLARQNPCQKRRKDPGAAHAATRRPRAAPHPAKPTCLAHATCCSSAPRSWAHEKQTPRDRRRASRTPWLGALDIVLSDAIQDLGFTLDLRNRRHGRAGDVRSRGHRSGREARTLGGLSHHRSPWIRADRTPRRRRAWLQGGVGAHRARQAERSRRSRRVMLRDVVAARTGTSAAELAPRRADRPESGDHVRRAARSQGRATLASTALSSAASSATPCSGDGQRRSPLAVSARGAGYRGPVWAHQRSWPRNGTSARRRLVHVGCGMVARSLGAPARSQPPAARFLRRNTDTPHRRAQRAWPRHDGAGARRRMSEGGAVLTHSGGALEPSSADDRVRRSRPREARGKGRRFVLGYGQGSASSWPAPRDPSPNRAVSCADESTSERVGGLAARRSPALSFFASGRRAATERSSWRP